MKIVFVGISGSGKTTLARKYAQLVDVPLLHLDSLYWSTDWKQNSNDYVRNSLIAFIKTHEEFVIEGFISHDFSAALDAADKIIYLDVSGIHAGVNVVRRWVKYYGNNRPELPAGCNESPSFTFMKMTLLRQESPDLENTLTPYQHKISRLTTRSQVKAFLASCC